MRPAEGRPAIVTGSAGVSCPVTLAAGVADFWSRRQSSSASGARLHCTSRLTQPAQASQAQSSRCLSARAGGSEGCAGRAVCTRRPPAPSGLPARASRPARRRGQHRRGGPARQSGRAVRVAPARMTTRPIPASGRRATGRVVQGDALRTEVAALPCRDRPLRPTGRSPRMSRIGRPRRVQAAMREAFAQRS